MPLLQSTTTVTSSESSSAPAYRRTSIPSLSTFSISIPASPNFSLQRTPLATAITQPSHLTLTGETFMESSFPPLDVSEDTERVADASRNFIGRQIISRPPEEDTSLSSPSYRRRSLSNHGMRSLPYPRSTQRRPSNTPAITASNSRRMSIPSTPHSSRVSPTVTASFLQPTPPSESSIYVGGIPANTDDIYSGLSTFTFGTARVPPSPHGSDSSDMISPLTRMSGTGSADRTPRPSISSSNGGRNRTRSALILDPDEGDDEFEDEDDAARGMSRSKMRAIDDGTRRPSLPTNSYAPGPMSPKRPITISSSVTSELSPSASSSQESGVDESEAEQDDPAEFDTDVEIDGRDSSVEPQHSDTASINTFGHRTHRENEVSSWRTSRGSMNVDDDNEDIISTSPVTFAHHNHGDQEDEGPVSPLSLNLSRRGSVWEREIPTSRPLDPMRRDREDSAATVVARRPSRSVAEETGLPTIMDSPPQTIGISDNRTTSHVVRSISSDDDSQSMSLGGDTLRASPIYNGLNLDYILGPGAAGRQSITSLTLSYVDHEQLRGSGEPSGSIAPWNSLFSAGRRQSVVTVGSVDPFTRHLGINDPRYLARRKDWSFTRESADGRGPQRASVVSLPMVESVEDTMLPGTQELWRQMYVGRFKVDRVSMPPEQPSKAPQQRLNVRHIADPYSKGNQKGGPGSVIHKHSRAIAFSIFRNHTLFSRYKDQYRPSQMTTSVSILLANRKVQEQYTSTRTTSKLNSHGLLEDILTPGPSASRDSVATSTRTSNDPTSPGHHDTHSIGGDDTFGADGWDNYDSSSRRTASLSSRSSPPAPVVPSKSNSPSTDTSSSRPPLDKMERTDSSHVSSDGQSSSHESEPSGNSGPTTSGSSTLRSESSRALVHKKSLMDIDDDEVSPPRTSHAEAFAAVDTTYIESIRIRSDPRQTPQERSSHGFMHGFRKILGQGSSRGPNKPVPPLSGASREGHFTPPWLTMAPRSKQEERERVIQNLNESFRDVGLLPTLRGNKRNSSKGKKRAKASTASIFATVPTDSLYMLLPLWPGETDKPSRELSEDPRLYTIAVEDRQYLLVYYVPFEKKQGEGKQKELTKKRSRADKLSVPVAVNVQNDKVIALHSFRICARLVGYDDLRGTGVRVPSYGLSVTGSMVEAAQYLPPPTIRELQLEDSVIVIGTCDSRKSGVEFLPEGLYKLGLCMPIDEPQIFVREEEEIPELVVSLTPIGQATVEMAWLGAMAVTSFGVY